MTEEEASQPKEAATEIRRRKLSPEERRRLTEDAKPGAVYREEGWEKRSHESLRRIHEAIDNLDKRRESKPVEDLPPGLRSRITSELGPAAYVQRSYSTKRHHVCHVGLRREGDIEDVIVLVGPEEVRRFEDIAGAVDVLEAEEGTPAGERA